MTSWRSLVRAQYRPYPAHAWFRTLSLEHALPGFSFAHGVCIAACRHLLRTPAAPLFAPLFQRLDSPVLWPSQYLHLLPANSAYWQSRCYVPATQLPRVPGTHSPIRLPGSPAGCGESTQRDTTSAVRHEDCLGVMKCCGPRLFLHLSYPRRGYQLLAGG